MTAQQMIVELLQLGKTQTEIANGAGCDQSTISRIKHGSEKFTHAIFKGIESYYLKVTNQAEEVA